MLSFRFATRAKRVGILRGRAHGAPEQTEEREVSFQPASRWPIRPGVKWSPGQRAITDQSTAISQRYLSQQTIIRAFYGKDANVFALKQLIKGTKYDR